MTLELKLYNTLTRRKELFEPLREGHIGFYLCGPTVYDSAHIGHARGPVVFDVARKFFVQSLGYKKKNVCIICALCFP